MAVKRVTASVNNTTYTMANVEGNVYSVDIRAPDTSANYDITLQAVDYEGSTTTVDSTHEKYGKLLTLNVVDEAADSRLEILTNELGNRMLDMVAPIYDRSKVALYLFQALGTVLQPEVDFVYGDFISQIFPQTATWGLKYWEDEFGVVTDETKSLEQRRAYLMSVMYKKYPMTPKRLEAIVTGITGYECEIVENVEPNTFLVVINGHIDEDDAQAVIDELDVNCPAHLKYVIQAVVQEAVSMESVTTGFALTELEEFEMEVQN